MSCKENKIIKNQLIQDVDEDSFEENSDKKNLKSDAHNDISEQGNKNKEEIRTLHGKPGNV